MWSLGSSIRGMTKGKGKALVEEEVIDAEIEDNDDDFVEKEWNNSGNW